MEFRKLVSTTVNSTVSQYLKAFLMDSGVILTNVIFLYGIMKSVSI